MPKTCSMSYTLKLNSACFFFPNFWVPISADYSKNFYGGTFGIEVKMNHIWKLFNQHTPNFLIADGEYLGIF